MRRREKGLWRRASIRLVKWECSVQTAYGPERCHSG